MSFIHEFLANIIMLFVIIVVIFVIAFGGAWVWNFTITQIFNSNPIMPLQFILLYIMYRAIL